MTLEELQALLDSGAITQEQFDKLAETIKEADPQPTDPDPTDPDPTDPKDPEPVIDLEKLNEIVQSRVDTALAADRKKYAELKKKYERLQKSKLTEDELKKVEDEEREKALVEREKALAEKENRLYAVKAIKEAGLDDGSDISLSLVDFVLGEDETEIDTKVKAFKELFDKAVSTEVDKRFKKNGYTPKKANELNGGVNPFKAETFNLTEQIRITNENPELAAKLKAEAGVK